MREALVGITAQSQLQEVAPLDPQTRAALAIQSSARYRSAVTEINQMRDREMERAMQHSRPIGICFPS